MIEISISEFKTFQNKENHIFFFSIPGLCGLCEIQKVEYEKFNIPNLIQVVGTITDEETMQQMDIQALPCTIMFDENRKQKLKKYGVLYDKQIKELLKQGI